METQYTEGACVNPRSHGTPLRLWEPMESCLVIYHCALNHSPYAKRPARRSLRAREGMCMVVQCARESSAQAGPTRSFGTPGRRTAVYSRLVSRMRERQRVAQTLHPLAIPARHSFLHRRPVLHPPATMAGVRLDAVRGDLIFDHVTFSRIVGRGGFTVAHDTVDAIRTARDYGSCMGNRNGRVYRRDDAHAVHPNCNTVSSCFNSPLALAATARSSSPLLARIRRPALLPKSLTACTNLIDAACFPRRLT